MLRTGAVLDGRYKILGVLGRGGTSCVYLAENERIKKYWAIKEVYKNSAEPSGRGGLIADIRMLPRLKHPGLPAIIDAFESPQAYYVVMEYIEGKPLHKILEDQGAQPEAVVMKWAKQLCDVLVYLHSQQPAIIYRDMKPSNIMLKPDGNVVLIDFGAAREFKSVRTNDTISFGTHGYAAPEQYMRNTQSDARTDIYSLGVTLYHLVTGRDPCFPLDGLQPIRQINPALSRQLEWIILKCTALNPADRYQSAEELRQALDNTSVEKIYFPAMEQTPEKHGSLLWLLALIPVFLLIIGISVAISQGAQNPSEKEYAALQAENEVWITKKDQHVFFEFTPTESGIYYFYSVSGDEIPVAWLSDENDKTLCEANTYGTNDDFEFSHRLEAMETYYLETALFTLDPGCPTTGKYAIYAKYSPG